MRHRLLLPAVALAAACPLAAQRPAAPAVDHCPQGFPFEMSMITESGVQDGEVFPAEPQVGNPGGRFRNRLLSGDAIVRVDGHLITTRTGSDRFWNPPANRSIEVVVRRQGRLLSATIPPRLCDVTVRRKPSPVDQLIADSILVANGPKASTLRYQSLGRDSVRFASSTDRPSIRADAVRADSIAAPKPRGAAGVPGAPPSRRDRPVPAADSRTVFDTIPLERLTDLVKRRDTTARFVRGTSAGELEVYDVKGQRVDRVEERVVVGASGTGWLGFGLDCRDCASRVHNGVRLWQFRAPPVVAGIEPGSPAELAGIRIGDVLRTIDRTPLESAAGATRFSTLRAGEQVRLQLERNGTVRDVLITATRRPGAS